LRRAGLRALVFFFGGLLRVAMGGPVSFDAGTPTPSHTLAAVTRPALLALLLALVPAAAADAARLGAGAWSWFGDPRAVYAGGSVYTGWIDRGGNVQVARYVRATGRVQVRTVKHGLGRDDHNGPSLLVRRDGRISAFFSPHSGYRLPPPGIAKRMYVRTTRRPGDIRRWGRLRTVRTNTRGGLGWTYPNPLELRRERRIWLFWRGGNWQPAFSTSRDGRRWRRARTLLRGPGRNRPYAKYDSNGRDSFDVAFDEGNPGSYRTGVRFARYRRGAFRTAGGRLIARMRSLPFRARAAESVYRPRRRGRAWVFDVAREPGGGRPVIAYVTYPTARAPLYRYAHWSGRRWVNHDVVRAGPPIGTRGRYAAGMSLDHEDPSTVYLSRRIRRHYEVERWRTRDGGRSWSHRAVTRRSRTDNIRPVTPRGLSGGDTVVWLRGRYPGYTTYMTSVATLRSFPRPLLVDLQRAPAS
jgi:hypothetical protein